MGTAIKHPVPDRVKPSFVRHPGTMTLSPEHQSARLSKITNDSWTRSGTGCYMATVGVKGLMHVDYFVGNHYRCSCHCVLELMCYGNPCEGGGTCHEDFPNKWYKCDCFPAFIGHRCETGQYRNTSKSSRCTPCPEKTPLRPKMSKITLWIENDSHYFSLCHEKPNMCNVCVKFHDR